MELIIMGYNKRHGSRRTAEPYGIFDVLDRAECYRYLNKLKTGYLSDTTEFFVKEVYSDGTDKDA